MAKWGGRFDTVDFRQQGADFIECKSMKQPRAVGDWFLNKSCSRVIEQIKDKIGHGRVWLHPEVVPC